LPPPCGDTVFRQGDAGKHSYAVESGQIDIIDEIDGSEEKVGRLAPMIVSG
jgi:CRP-like cAMP-binding protein